MSAIGLDIGGTKIAAHVYDGIWGLIGKRRAPTPMDYQAFLEAIVESVRWAQEIAQDAMVGISVAGVVDPVTGMAVMANLPAHGHKVIEDLESLLGHQITLVNDCRAMTLSEAVLGAGQGHRCVVGMIIGTGIGGGAAINGVLHEGQSGIAGEFGHGALPASVVKEHDLPLITCGCGRVGCVETLVAGPGLSRIMAHFGGGELTAKEIAEARAANATAQKAWEVWCQLVAELLLGATLAFDPDVVVLAGGVSQAEGTAGDVQAALDKAQIKGFRTPKVVIAEGGDASGARGAALAAQNAEGQK